MTYALGRALLRRGTVSPEALAHALHVAVTTRVSLLRALLDTGVAEVGALDRELARSELPVFSGFSASVPLLAALPPGLAHALLAVPVGYDPNTGIINVAVADGSDLHSAREIAFHLGATARVVRAPRAAIEAALQEAGGMGTAPSMPRSPERSRAAIASQRRDTPLWGTPVAFSTQPEPVSAPHVGGPEECLGGEEEDIPILLARTSSPSVPRTSSAPAPDPPDPPDPPEPADAHHDTPRDFDSERPLALSQAKTWANLPGAGRALPEILASLEAASNRDEVLDLMLRGGREVASRAALFVVRKNAFEGWACAPPLPPAINVRLLHLEAAGDHVLARTATAGLYTGTILQTDANAPLQPMLRGFGGADATVVAVASRVRGRAAVVLVAVGVTDVSAAVTALHRIGRAAGEALERMVRPSR